MAGGGKIIEKIGYRMHVGATTADSVRYRVMSEYRPGWYDETYVCAEPADDEPQLGDTIWWGAGSEIYWGENDSKRLVKVGFSWSADRLAASRSHVGDTNGE